MTPKLQQELFDECLQGHESAIEFAYMLAEVSQTIDDLIDGDKPVKKSRIYNLLVITMVDLHTNEFFLLFRNELLPVMSLQINQWMAANYIEHEADLDENVAQMMHVSFITKSAFTPIFLHMCHLIGGRDHALKCATRMYPLIYGETFMEYMAEHGVHDYGMFQQLEEGPDSPDSGGEDVGTDGPGSV